MASYRWTVRYCARCESRQRHRREVFPIPTGRLAWFDWVVEILNDRLKTPWICYRCTRLSGRTID